MSYRPICDLWFLARAKLRGGQKYYGSYLGGFPERARALLGVTIEEPVLHVCGGMARLYPYSRGFGPNDKTLDLNPLTDPDYLQDALEPIQGGPWPAILCDPPYSVQDSEHYPPGPERYPVPNRLLSNCLSAVRVGGRVGIIHYVLPSPPKNAHFVAAIGVLCGFNNRIRCFSVFERTE